MIHSLRLLPLTALSLLILSFAVGCKQNLAPPLSDEDIQRFTQGQPEIFALHQGHLTLVGLDGLYLGQPFDEAMEKLEEHCDLLEVFDGGWRHNHAVFKGCIIDEGPRTRTLRVGFWPTNENRVSTLELKDRRLNQPLIRARFTQIAGPLTQDLPRRGLLMMADSQHRLFASWDDGEDQPAHIIIGFQP